MLLSQKKTSTYYKKMNVTPNLLLKLFSYVVKHKTFEDIS